MQSQSGSSLVANNETTTASEKAATRTMASKDNIRRLVGKSGKVERGRQARFISLMFYNHLESDDELLTSCNVVFWQHMSHKTYRIVVNRLKPVL